MPDTIFEVLKLPNLSGINRDDETAGALAKKYREYRLHALRTEPAAFAATYEEEKQRSMGHTFDRLANSKATHFAAVLMEESSAGAGDSQQEQIAKLSRLPWYGMIVLLGPQSGDGAVTAQSDPFSRMTTTGDRNDLQGPDTADMRFHLNGVFVDHESRGMGLAKLLMRHAIMEADRQASAAQKILRCTVIVDENNPQACGLYLGSGFKVISKEQYTKRRATTEGRVEEEWTALEMELRRQPHVASST